MSALFLPGTIIHEMAHAFMAIMLFIPVGKMELIPKLVGNNLKLGSVEVGRSDPIRRLFIGAGPFIFGVALLLGLFFYGARNQLFAHHLYIITSCYAVFEIGNTMFSSKKDMEGALEVILALLGIFVVLYFLGVRLPAFNPEVLFSNPLTLEVFKKACLYLSIPLAIDVVSIMVLKIVSR